MKLKGGRQLDPKEELVLPANAEVQDGKADMTELRNLNEATLLHNMRGRARLAARRTPRRATS